MDTTIQLDGETFLKGLQWAANGQHADGPLLCVLKGRLCKLALISGTRLAIAWQALRPTADQGDGFFLIPGPVAQELAGITPAPIIMELGPKHAALTTGWQAQIKREWDFDPRDLAAPPQFGQMIIPNTDLLQVGYVALSDVVHRAIAGLGEKDANESVPRNKLAILVKLEQSSLIVDGVEISRSQPQRFYFDPRLMVRSLECLESPQIGLGMRQLGFGNRAILYLVAKGMDHTVSCGLLSISLETQKLYPLPPRPGRDVA